MKRTEFLSLADKYLNGTLTPEEEVRFLEASASLENQITSWDEQLLGPPQQTKERLYNKIKGIISDDKADEADKHRNRWRFFKYAAVFAGLLVIAGFFRYQIYNSLFPGKWLTVATGSGTMKNITLPDGTHVFLNAGGTLRYPEVFRDSVRNVFLSGEAFFQVTHTGKPFQIHSGKLTTRVLGTSFIIKSYPQDHQAKVTVITGKVWVKHGDTQKKIILTPGQEVTAYKWENALHVRKNIDGTAAMAWMQHKRTYRQNPLSEVIDDLKRSYKVQIDVDSRLLQCLIYIDIEPDERLEDILAQLAYSLNGKVKKEDAASYQLTGSGCNN